MTYLDRKVKITSFPLQFLGLKIFRVYKKHYNGMRKSLKFDCSKVAWKISMLDINYAYQIEKIPEDFIVVFCVNLQI